MRSIKPFRASDVPQSVLGKLNEVMKKHLNKAVNNKNMIDAAHETIEVFMEHYNSILSTDNIVPWPTISTEVEADLKKWGRKLMTANGWYKGTNQEIILNINVMGNKIGIDTFGTIIHEFRHHLQYTCMRRFLLQGNEPDAHKWSTSVVEKAWYIAELRHRKLMADRRCRARYPERYGKKGDKTT